MKRIKYFYMVLLLSVAINALGLSTNQSVVFLKKMPDGTSLEVIREILPRAHFTNNVSSANSAVATNITPTNFESRLQAHLYSTINDTSVVTRGSGLPLPDYVNYYFIAVHDGQRQDMHKEFQFQADLFSASNAVEFLDVISESNVAVYLYCRQFEMMPWKPISPPLFVTMVLPAFNTAEQSKATTRMLWEPLAGQYTKFQSARIIGNYEAGTLAIEVTSMLNHSMIAQTNSYVNGKWIVSKGNPVPVKQ